MAGIRNVDIDQTIRGLAGEELTDEQVWEIRDRAYEYMGGVFVEAVPPGDFWKIVEEVSC